MGRRLVVVKSDTSPARPRLARNRRATASYVHEGRRGNCEAGTGGGGWADGSCHSYGGVVITEAGNDPKVSALVYIAAFAPDAGQSVGSLGASAEPAPMGAEARPDSHGFLKITEAGVMNDFAQDLSPTEKDVLFAAQAPTAAGAFGENLSAAAWKTKSSGYLVANQDRALHPSLERAMAKTIKAKTIEVHASHVAMLARPQETANLILEAVA